MDKFKKLGFVEVLTVIAFVRFLIFGNWAEAMIVVAGMVWMAYDSYQRKEEMKKENKEKSEVEKIQERVTKLELAYGFKKPNA